MESRWNDLEKQELMIRNCVLTALARQAVRFVPVGISARHVHLSQADLQVLFGSGHALQPKKELSQPGQFAAEEQVTVVGPQGEAGAGPGSRPGPQRDPGGACDDRRHEAGYQSTGAHGPAIWRAHRGASSSARPGNWSFPRASSSRPGISIWPGTRRRPMACTTATGSQCASSRPGPAFGAMSSFAAGKGHDLEMHIDTDEANSALLSNGAYVELVADTAACQAPAAPAVQAAPSVSAIAQAAAASFAAAASAVRRPRC